MNICKKEAEDTEGPKTAIKMSSVYQSIQKMNVLQAFSQFPR